MKPIISMLCLAASATILAASPSGSRISEETADDYALSPAVTEMILGYTRTLTPDLPEPERWDELDSPFSAAPGRMRIAKKIIVDKPNTRLYVMNVFGDTLSRYRVCASRERGQKSGKDDWRTPEGTFKVYGIYNSTDWTYKDTNDKCYGPFFIALWTPPFYGIGIHGTNSPYSVPGRRSHGCMRMHNEDILRVRQMVDKDTRVTILPDYPDGEPEK